MIIIKKIIVLSSQIEQFADSKFDNFLSILAQIY